MFIEFIDQLRCTAPHEDSWLVASITRRDDRFLVEATLGCPICQRQYPITRGVAYFGASPPAVPLPVTSPNEELTIRAAAFLNAAERSTLVLAGTWAARAHEIAALIPLRIIALNPTTHIDSEHVAIINSTEGIPLAPKSVDGIALDAQTATDANLQSALNVLRPTARLVAPAAIPLPGDTTLIVSDETYWIAETTSPLLALKRRGT